MKSSLPKSLLFLKLGALGDVIMALPLSRYLESKGTRVTWVVGKSAEPLVRAYSQATHIIALDDQNLLAGSSFKKAFLAAKTFFNFLGSRFDQILIAHSDPRYAWLVAGACGKKTRFFSPHSTLSPSTLSQHHSYAYFDLIKHFIPNEMPDPKGYLPTPRIFWKGAQSKKIALAPGGAKNLLADDPLRRWPLSHYRKLAERCLEQGWEVEIFGSDSDLWVLEAFQGLNVQSQLGKLKLLEFIDCLAERAVLITHDSGPLHLAGLAGIPVIGLFGPVPAQSRFPLNNPGQALELPTPLPCQPCYDGKKYADCTDNQCLKQLLPEVVFNKVRDILART